MAENQAKGNGNSPDRLSDWTFWLAVGIVAFIIIIAAFLAISAGVIGVKIVYLGALLFGIVVGWITYRTLRRTGEGAAVSDIAAVISAVSNTTVPGLWANQTDNPDALSWYLIGLFFGFFVFYLVSLFVGNARTELLLGKNTDTQ